MKTLCQEKIHVYYIPYKQQENIKHASEQQYKELAHHLL